MNDLVGDQAKKYSLVESKIISLVNSYGFDEVRTPLAEVTELFERSIGCLLYTSPSPRDKRQSRKPSSA